MIGLRHPTAWRGWRLTLAVKTLPIALPQTFPLDLATARPQIFLLDEVALDRAKVSQVTIPALDVPAISTDLSPTQPDLVELGTSFPYPLLTRAYEAFQPLLRSPVESVFEPLAPPRKDGKAYEETAAEPAPGQPTFEGEEWQEPCKHGFSKKQLCVDCRNQARAPEPKQRHLNPFDLILPILQPPLGKDFDNIVCFPSPLYPFQVAGVKALCENQRFLLGDEMGLGKSIQAITAARFLFRQGKVTSVLILSPKSVIGDWKAKIAEWAPELTLGIIRGQQELRSVLWTSQYHVYMTTYETLREDIEDVPKTRYDLCIADEIQKIKNPGAGITQAARQVDAAWRWGLSGTPLENRLEELVSVFAYLKPGLLHEDDALYPQVVQRKIKPYFLRRRITEALPELPPIKHGERWLELTDTQRETYDQADQAGLVMLNALGNSVTVQHVLALITKLKQICNLDPVSGESCKLEFLYEQLEKVVEAGDKALVFSQYPGKTLEPLMPRLQEFKPVLYHGSLSDTERDGIIKEFQDGEESKVFLGSVKAGGLGITLTRANHVFHYDLWWNPAVAWQAEGRAHRIGQSKPVFVTSILTLDTIEERIQKLLERKKREFKEVIDDLSDTNLSQVLTEEELFGLFGLERRKPRPEGWTAERLARLSPQEFETLVAELYRRMGYRVDQTPVSRDRGVDAYARRVSDTGTDDLVIQCKHYPGQKVGPGAARDLWGVVSANHKITKGVLVTSGEFSDECISFAQGKRLELVNGSRLLGLLAKYMPTESVRR